MLRSARAKLPATTEREATARKNATFIPKSRLKRTHVLVPQASETTSMTQFEPNAECDRRVATLVQEARVAWASAFGQGSLAELCELHGSFLLQAAEENLDALERVAPDSVERVERAHCARYGAAALRAELAEQRQRDAAVSDDSALVSYHAKWRGRLLTMQRSHPERWRVRGLSAEEVQDLLTLRLLEAVRGDVEEFSRLARAGREWGLLCVQAELLRLRRHFRVHAVPADPCEFRVRDSAQTQEEQWLEREQDWARELARTRAVHGLSRPQRAWLKALDASADAGAFFHASREPNLSAASRLLGKNRSSALRAYRELQGRFIREMKRIG
jgi:hypothetical protein